MEEYKPYMLIVRTKLTALLKEMTAEGKISLDTELLIREEILKNWYELQPERKEKW